MAECFYDALSEKDSMTSKPVLSVVIPCFNEEEALPHTLQQLMSLLQRLKADGVIDARSYVCLVDDGSRDHTWTLIHHACLEHPTEIRGIKLAGNVGHQNALYAGLVQQVGKCDASISLDADLQDSTEAIVDMIRAYVQEGADLVYGVRRSRTKDTVFKRETAQWYYRLLRWLGADIIQDHADFRLMSQRALKILAQYQEVQLFLRGLVRLFGLKESLVYFDREERLHGTSKYTLKKMLSLALTGITSLSTRPLRIITLMGMLCLGVALSMGVWVIHAWMVGQSISGWTSLVCIQLFFFGTIILSLGVVAEYIGRIYIETKSRPRYFIEQEC